MILGDLKTPKVNFEINWPLIGYEKSKVLAVIFMKFWNRNSLNKLNLTTPQDLYSVVWSLGALLLNVECQLPTFFSAYSFFFKVGITKVIQISRYNTYLLWACSLNYFKSPPPPPVRLLSDMGTSAAVRVIEQCCGFQIFSMVKQSISF